MLARARTAQPDLARCSTRFLLCDPPDPAAELLAALGIEASEVRKRFAELEGDSQP
jgi:hypothetical protein